jgi:O-antigen/teichoic acid export membrane protein
VLLIPSLLTLVLFSKTIIRFLFGDNYIGASNTLIILSVAFSFIVLSSLLFSIFSAVGQAKRAAKVVLLMAILNILGCIIMVNTLGLEGVALSTLISGLLLFLFLMHDT